MAERDHTVHTFLLPRVTSHLPRSLDKGCPLLQLLLKRIEAARPTSRCRGSFLLCSSRAEREVSMKTVQQMLICGLLAALTTLAVAATVFVRAATATVAAVPAEIRLTRTALLQEAGAARQDLTRQIAAARVAALAISDRQATAFRTGILAQSADFGEAAGRRLGGTLSKLDATLATTTAIELDLRPTLQHSASITAQIDDSLPVFLDCDHNPDCVFNRYVGVSRGIEHAAIDVSGMSADFRRDWPAYLKTWQDIGVQTDGFVANMNRLTHPHWYDRLIGYGLNGVVIYRTLNPLGAAVTGAQILSSRP